jgi:hypothetical protein
MPGHALKPIGKVLEIDEEQAAPLGQVPSGPPTKLLSPGGQKPESRPEQ